MAWQRRSGRWSPEAPASDCGSLPDLQGSSRTSSMAASDMGSYASSDDTPPGSRSPVVPRPPAPAASGARMLLRALLPLVVLVLTAASMHRRNRAHAQLADELLAAARSRGERGGLARQLGEAAQAAAPNPGRACAEALQVPQVAMLFLVKGPLRHEALWRKWFEQAAGLLPAQAVSNALCASEEGMPDALAACSSLASGAAPAAQRAPAAGSAAASSNGSGGLADWLLGSARHPAGRHVQPGVLDRQHLFNVYVHPHPNFTGYSPGSLLYGRELPDSQRVTTEWGTHSLVDAAEALLGAAVKNRRNAKFLILSESDLPLYSPHVFYLQLMSEHRSRLNACNTTAGWDLDHYRWVERMRTPFLTQQLWRKSSQWFVLNRKHAELVLADRRVEAVFRRHCRTMYETDRGSERVCYSDEHYFPTLLAVHGLDAETDCQGRVMDVDWSRVDSTSPHPWEYQPGEVSVHLFDALRRRQRPGCGSAAGALATAPAAFLQQEQLFQAATAAEAAAANVPELERLGRGVCAQLLLHQQEQPAYPGIGPACPLMARKFSDGTQKAALMALAPCDSPALVLNDGRCPGETPRRQRLRQLWWQAAPWVLLGSAAAACIPLLAPLWALPRRVLARSRRHQGVAMTAPLLDV